MKQDGVVVGDRVPSIDCGKDLQHKSWAVSISYRGSVVGAGHKHRSGQCMVGKAHHREAQGMVCLHSYKEGGHSMDHDTCRHRDLHRAGLCTDRSPGGHSMGHHKVLLEGIQDILV